MVAPDDNDVSAVGVMSMDQKPDKVHYLLQNKINDANKELAEFTQKVMSYQTKSNQDMENLVQSLSMYRDSIHS